jgi:hypothetical protein
VSQAQCWQVFRDPILKIPSDTVSLFVWAGLLIAASSVARIIGRSHQCLTRQIFLIHLFSSLLPRPPSPPASQSSLHYVGQAGLEPVIL